MIYENKRHIKNSRKVIKSSKTFDDFIEFSHEIAKGIISGKLSQEEAVEIIMKELKCSYDYANGLVMRWVLNEPTYNGLVMTSSKKPIKSSHKAIKSSHDFSKDIVRSILSNRMSEEQAVRKIALKNNCNVGYAKQILNRWMNENTEKLIKSDAEIADIQKEFNVDGDLNSWADEYMPGSGKANTKGGELVRAAQRILNEYYENGNMIGRGYGNETVNPAARYIVEKTSFEGNGEIQDMLDHVVQMEDSEYNSWCVRFENDFADYLRDKGDLFAEPNDDDIANYAEPDDIEFFLNNFYVEDEKGNKYLFELKDEDWVCKDIYFATEPVYYDEEFVSEGDELSSEFSKTDDYGSFEKDGFTYDWEASGVADENGNYDEWKVVRVTITDQPFEKDDVFDMNDIENYKVFDNNGNALTAEDFSRI